MKLEEGMYVRTDLGNIGKIVEEYTHQNYKVSYPEPQEWVLDTGYILNEAMMYQNEEIIKSSYNLIDLIEVGDYVNGFYVEDVKETFVNVATGSDYFQSPTIYEEQIKSILTRELFESMKYEVK